jgi:hypothetical protein
MEDTQTTQPNSTRPILVVHTAVCYDQCQGLGVGLVQRVACAKTGRTRNDVLETQKQGVKVGCEGFAASRKNPHRRADMLALLKALHLAHATVKKRWPQTAASTTVLILLGRPCKEIMDIITHHIEHGPESYKALQDPHRSTVKRIIKRIHQIRNAGFKVSVQMSDHHDSGIQLAAARVAERKFKRACHDARKLVTEKTRPETERPSPATKHTCGKDAVLALRIRENHVVNGV